MMLVLMFSLQFVNAQLSVNISYSGVNPVPTGQEMCFDVSYTWSSTTMDLNGAKIEIPLPPEILGNSAGDVSQFNSPHVATAGYDPVTRIMKWTMVDPLPAGSSGTVKFCVKFANGTTPNNTNVTLTPTFSGTGVLPATDGTTVTASAAPKASLTKSLKTDPALDNTATYSIVVNNSQGTGNYNLTNVVITDNIPAGATFVSATAGGTESGGVVTWNIPTLNVDEIKYLKVVIMYPSGTFNVGDMVTNNVSMTGTSPEGPMPTITASKTNTISVPNAKMGLAKYSSTDWMSLNGNVSYSIYHNNEGNVPLTNVIMEDSLPNEFSMNLLALGIDATVAPVNAIVEYQTKSNPTWQVWPGSPFQLPANPLAPDRTYLTVSALGFDPTSNTPTDFVTRFRITYDQYPVNYDPANNTASTFITGKPVNPDRDGNTYTFNKPINNTVTSEFTGAGATKNLSYTDPATIVPASPKPTVYKSLASNYTQQPNNTVQYNFALTNQWDASEALIHPQMGDLLPPDISIDPASMTGLSGNPGAPTLEVTNNFMGTGRQLVLMKWPTKSFQIGETQYFSLLAKIKPGAPPGVRTNQLFFLKADNSFVNGCSNPVFIRDTFDLNQNGLTLTDTLPAAYDVSLNIIETTAIEALKLVKGQCDTVFHKFPSVGKTTQGGTFQYRLTVTNVGNKPLTKIKIMDILPWVGDVGVITHPTNRDSKYDPIFVGLDVIPAGISTMYSASTNPCRADLDPSITEAPGCTGGTFSATPMADPQSLLFDFGTTIIQPADSLVLFWTMRVPYGIAPGDVAWNSFGHRSESTTGTIVPPAEPIKVGVTVKSAQIGNFVWIDTNKDGVQNNGEVGLAGVVVHLLDMNMQPVINPITMMPVTTTTDANGMYIFNVDPGMYFVQFDQPASYGFTINTGLDPATNSDVDNTGKSTKVTVADGDVNLTLDAGLVQCIAPVPTFTVAVPTCQFDGTPNNNGSITLDAVTNADKYGFNSGSTYTGPAYAAATAITTPLVLQSAIANTGGTFTIRLFNLADNCYLDSTIIVAPVNCVAGCVTPTTTFAQTAPTCSVAGLANNDGKITLTFAADADKYGVSTGTTYSGPAYAAATALGTLPSDVQTSISNAGATYTVRLFNKKDDCFKDTTIVIDPVVCIIPCVIPTTTFAQTAPTCSVTGLANNDGKITLTFVADADKYGVSAGATYSGPAYATATALGALPLDVQTSISNAGATYTVRLFNKKDDCFKDTTIIIDPVTCVIPCVTPTTTFAQTAPTCQFNGTANNDGKITLTFAADADKYGVSTGVSYSGPAYAVATALGTLPLDVQISIANAGATYTIRLFNKKDDCFKDTTIVMNPVVCVAGCVNPTSTFAQSAPTCGATGLPNNDGKITLTAFTNADKYGVSVGATYIGAAYAAATALGTAPLDVQTGISNAGGTYTIRLFNAADACFRDMTITIDPVTCVVPCSKITLGPVPLPSGMVGTPYSVQVTATGGVAPYTFIMYDGSTGTIPVGLTMSPSGLITGTPTTTGSYAIKITVLDSKLCPDTLDPAAITILPAACVVPTSTFTQSDPTCSAAGTANNDGSISLSSFTNADKYGISIGSTYTGPAYATATSLGTAPIVVKSAIANTGGTYTIRLFNAANDCILDTVVTVNPVNCVIPCLPKQCVPVTVTIKK